MSIVIISFIFYYVGYFIGQRHKTSDLIKFQEAMVKDCNQKLNDIEEIKANCQELKVALLERVHQKMEVKVVFKDKKDIVISGLDIV